MKKRILRRAAGWLLAAMVCLMPAQGLAQQQNTGVRKQETVYGELNADGSPKTTTVSVYLSNPDGLEKIDDVTNLESLETLAGDLPPDSQSGQITWNARGEDVLYQGVSQQQLPVGIQITYELDGKTIAPEELLGKSGRLVMRFTYTNHECQRVSIGGKEVDIYTPFTVATTLTLPHDHFTLIQTDADRTMTQGDTTMIMDLAFPGLAESLDRSDDEMGGGTMTLEAEVTDFTLEEMTFLVTPKLIEESDLSELENLDDLKEGLQEADEGGDELSQGADSLQAGAYQFARGVDDFTQGVDQLAEGLAALADGMPQLSGAASQLAEGLKTLEEQAGGFLGSEEGNPLESMLSGESGLGQLMEAAGKLVENSGSLVAGLDASLEAMETAIQSMEAAGAPQEQIEQLKQQMEHIRQLREEAAANQSSLYGQLQAMQGQLQEIKQWGESLSANMTALVGGISSLATGAGQLSEGLAEIEGQTGKLKSGSAELKEGAGEVKSGAWRLARAAGQLSGALDTFNEEAIDRLAGDTAAEIEDFQARKDALLAASEAYTSFTGQPDGVACEVSFVLRTPLQQAQSVPEPEPEPQQPEPEPTGWQRFWSWLTGIFGG